MVVNKLSIPQFADVDYAVFAYVQCIAWSFYRNTESVCQFLGEAIFLSDLLSCAARQQPDILPVPAIHVADDRREQTRGHIRFECPISYGSR